MRACACGVQLGDDVDFCPRCGRYLAWDDTPNGANGAAGGTATQVIPVRAATAADQVSVQLFLPGGEVGEGPVTAGVRAGERALLMARVRNLSEEVESYRVSVDGLPPDWVTIDPGAVYLLSLDSREGYEQDVTIAIQPPRAPQATAARWALTVTATSTDHPTRSASARAGLDIEPFWAIALEARPNTVTGWRRGRLAGVVHNRGNAPVPVALTAVDGEARCSFSLPAAPVDVPSGDSRWIGAEVQALKLHPIGRRIEHRLELKAQTADDQALTTAVPALFRQRPLIAWWIPVALILLALAAVILWLLWPRHAKVPDVRGLASPFAAQKRLEKAGLRLDPHLKVVHARRGIRPGTVMSQAPKPGKVVDKGKAVGVVVMAGRTKVKVPRITGLHPDQADERLQNAGLTLGAVTPKLDPKLVVVSQVPMPKVLRRRGTPVSAVLGKPHKKGKAKVKAAGGKPVPAVAGASAAAAVAALKKAGLEPVVEMRIATAKRGTVLATVPGKGEPPPADGKVKLIVSAGFPQLALDDGRDGKLVGGAAGRPVVGISSGRTTVATGGAWSADGRRVAYARKRRLYVLDPASGRHAKHIRTPASRRVVSPAFAPYRRRTVIAFVDRNASGGDAVCWIDITERTTRPSCLLLAGWSVDALSWSPTGKEMLAAASGGGKFGMLRLTTTDRFSSDAHQWRAHADLATPTQGGRGVRAAAFSPRDGSRLAVVTDTDTPDFRVALVKSDDLKLHKPRFLPLSGCDVAWRSDGKELAVVQADSACSTPIGPIVRVRPDDPRTVQTVVLKGEHPAWQPIDLSPGPGP